MRLCRLTGGQVTAFSLAGQRTIFDLVKYIEDNTHALTHVDPAVSDKVRLVFRLEVLLLDGRLLRSLPEDILISDFVDGH